MGKKAESTASKILYWCVGVPVGLFCIFIAIKIATN